MGLGLGISVDWASLVPYYARVASAFKARVEADGGTVESMSCLKADLKVLTGKLAPDLLLNDYDGAAAAYSLRLLDKSYSGNAIKVRRASDNAEQDIAFSNNELDTATLETFASGTDAFVTTWYDQSGNANNATQATASSQPKIVSSGSTILESGKPSIDFASNKSLFESSVSLTQPFTRFSVRRYTNESVSNDVFLQQNSGSFSNLLDIGFSARKSHFGSYLSGDSETFTNNISYLLANGASSETKENNSTLYTGNTGTNGLSGLRIGLSPLTSFFRSNVKGQEIIIWNNDQSSNRTGIETNINDFYSIY